MQKRRQCSAIDGNEIRIPLRENRQSKLKGELGVTSKD
jgi:hypothetical protein